jgi:hypothetical protein
VSDCPKISKCRRGVPVTDVRAICNLRPEGVDGVSMVPP